MDEGEGDSGVVDEVEVRSFAHRVTKEKTAHGVHSARRENKR